MSESLLPVDPKKTSREVCAAVDLGEEAEELLADDQTPDEFFEALRENKHFFDAIRVLATVLHPLLAVEWACNCVRTSKAIEDDEAQGKLLEVAEAWVKNPSEANRGKTAIAAEESEYKTAASWANAAAAWSGGSLMPPDLPPVPPGEDLTPKAVSGAISMVAVENTAQIEKRAAEMIEIGLEFAKVPRPSEPINIDGPEPPDAETTNDDEKKPLKMKSLRPEYTKTPAPDPAAMPPPPQPLPLKPRPASTPATLRPARPSRPPAAPPPSRPSTPPPPSSPWGKPPADDGGWNPKPL